jgi:uracil-DNA glycosylase family 4
MKPPSCKGCPLYDNEGPIWGSGSPSSRLVILGQNPGPQEVKEGRPFCGTSGRILDRALMKASVSRTQNFVTNIVKCFVAPGTPIPAGAVEKCRPLLERELSMLPQATTILTLGGEAFDEVAAPKKFHMLHDRRVSKSSPTYWLRGCPYQIERWGRRFTIIPTLHPSFVARTGFTLAPVLEADITKAGRFAGGQASWATPSYDYNPSPSQIEEYVRHILAKGECGLDIETPESSTEEDELNAEGFLPIGLIGLSAERHHAIGVRPDHFHLLHPLFSNPHTVVWVYNAGFDFHHLKRHFDLKVRRADAMLAFHLLRPEVVRKDLATAMSFYTDLPFHKNLQLTDPDAYNAADTYGVLEAGQNMLTALRGLGGRQKIFPWASQTPETLFWNHLMPIIPTVGEWAWKGAPYDQTESDRQEMAIRLTLDKYTEWWDKNIPLFSWSSPKQLVEMFEMQGVKVPKVKRPNGTFTPSVDDEFLEKLEARGNQTAKLVRTLRELRKAGDFLGLASEDSRVYCRAKLHGQVGGRIQTVNQNMQQVPETIAGTSPRRCIVAENPSTDLVVSADYSQIEFWLYCWYSQCKRGLEIKESGDYLYAAFYEDIWKEPFFLPGKPRKKQFRNEATTPSWKLLVAKSWPLGFTYGRGVPDPSKQGLPIGKTEARRIYEKFHQDYPEFKEFHAKLKFLATKYGYLQTVFGRIRNFPNPEGQHNEVLAFPGQSTAVDVLIRNVLLPLPALLEREFGERSRIYFTVHDSAVMNINCAGPDGRFSLSRAYDAYDFIKEQFEKPIPEMGNFVLPCEVKIGTSWGDGVSKEKLKDLLNGGKNPSRAV